MLKHRSQFVCSLLRPSENMLIRANTDGTYSANWTPGAVGLYTIHVTIDGIEIGKRSWVKKVMYFRCFIENITYSIVNFKNFISG